MPRLRLRHAPAALLIWLVVVVMVTSCSLRLASSGGGEAEAAIEGLPAEFARLAEVWELLQRQHIDGADLDGQALSDGAIRGMLQALDDPYAAFLTAEQFKLESQDIKGFFEGIGAEVGLHPSVLSLYLNGRRPIPRALAKRLGGLHQPQPTQSNYR